MPKMTISILPDHAFLIVCPAGCTFKTAPFILPDTGPNGWQNVSRVVQTARTHAHWCGWWRNLKEETP